MARPAPYWFLPIGAAMIDELTHGWGCIPVTYRLGRTEFTTSIMPRQGAYLIPRKDKVRAAEGVTPGSPMHVSMTLR